MSETTESPDDSIGIRSRIKSILVRAGMAGILPRHFVTFIVSRWLRED